MSLQEQSCCLGLHITRSILCLSLLQADLLAIQFLLNATESSLHQLTALLDCRGLYKVPGVGGAGEDNRGPHFPVESRTVVTWARQQHL